VKIYEIQVKTFVKFQLSKKLNFKIIEILVKTCTEMCTIKSSVLDAIMSSCSLRRVNDMRPSQLSECRTDSRDRPQNIGI